MQVKRNHSLLKKQSLFRIYHQFLFVLYAIVGFVQLKSLSRSDTESWLGPPYPWQLAIGSLDWRMSLRPPHHLPSSMHLSKYEHQSDRCQRNDSGKNVITEDWLSVSELITWQCSHIRAEPQMMCLTILYAAQFMTYFFRDICLGCWSIIYRQTTNWS